MGHQDQQRTRRQDGVPRRDLLLGRLLLRPLRPCRRRRRRAFLEHRHLGSSYAIKFRYVTPSAGQDTTYCYGIGLYFGDAGTGKLIGYGSPGSVAFGNAARDSYITDVKIVTHTMTGWPTYNRVCSDTGLSLLSDGSGPMVSANRVRSRRTPAPRVPLDWAAWQEPPTFPPQQAEPTRRPWDLRINAGPVAYAGADASTCGWGQCGFALYARASVAADEPASSTDTWASHTTPSSSAT